ncbi:MAG: thioredoxin-dependent thiol peroxidase [Candidatus Bathyarchaeia archaeon]|jgi:peroxiredoxin Q/BCP
MLPKKATISIGSKAPDFVLKDHEGRLVKLSEFRGKKVILFFYVRDDTPGCTRESCNFRDRMENIRSKNAVVLGVSPDSVESHKRFVEKYHLTFPLLADEDAVLAKKFGVWGKKNMYGRTFYGIIRSTFVINEEGRVEKEFRHVRVDGHLDRVFQEI